MTFNEAITKLMKTYVEYPPRKPQSEAYSGPITLSQYQRFSNIREQLQKKGSSWRCRPVIKMTLARARCPGLLL